MTLPCLVCDFLLQDGLANLFSRAGKVLKATVMKAKDASQTTTYGWVNVLLDIGELNVKGDAVFNTEL